VTGSSSETLRVPGTLSGVRCDAYLLDHRPRRRDDRNMDNARECEYADEVPSRRDLALAGFRIHAAVTGVTIGLAVVAWTVLSVLGRGPRVFFPIFPIAFLTPFVALHAVGVYRRVPADADLPLRLPPFFRYDD